MPHFVGLDLAWTGHNETGICWFEGETPADLTCTAHRGRCTQRRGLADEVAAVEGSAIVAIDAPVLYTAERWAESEIAAALRAITRPSPHQVHYAVRRDDGRHPASVRRSRRATLPFTRKRYSRGERDGRVVVEVFPHTIHVRLFDLAERIPYKRKTGRSVGFRRGRHAAVSGALEDTHRKRDASRP